MLWAQTDTRFDFEWQIKISFNNTKRLGEALPDHKSWRRLREIWLYDVLLCKSERESDFDIFGCMSECETIRLAISLVCLICNISLLHETWRLVAIHAVSMLHSFGTSGPGVVQGLNRSAVDLSLGPQGWCPISSFFSEGLHVLPRLFVYGRHHIEIKTPTL